MILSNSVLIGLLTLSQLGCARVPYYTSHHRHHSRNTEGLSTAVEGTVSDVTAAVVEGPPDHAVISVAPPPNDAVVDVVVVDVLEDATGGIAAEATVTITGILGPVPTTGLPVPSAMAPSTYISNTIIITSITVPILTTGLPVPTSITVPTYISNLTASLSSVATYITQPVVDTTSKLPISVGVPNFSKFTNTTIPGAPTSNGTLSTISTAPTTTSLPTIISPTNSTIANSTIPPSSYTTITSVLSTTPTPTPTTTKTKTRATRTWITLGISTSTSTSTLPVYTSLPTTLYSSVKLSFQMPTYSPYSKAAPSPTDIVDLSTLPVNVSANSPCYNDNCPNPDSGWNYKTTVPVQLDYNSTKFTNGGAGGSSGFAAVAVVVAVVVGVMVLL